MAFQAAVGLASADQATAMKKQADEGLAALKGLAPMLGIPAKAVETLKVDASGATISVSASMGHDDVKQLKDKAGAMMGGLMGGAPRAPEALAEPVAPAGAAPVRVSGCSGRAGRPVSW